MLFVENFTCVAFYEYRLMQLSILLHGYQVRVIVFSVISLILYLCFCLTIHINTAIQNTVWVRATAGFSASC